MSKSAAWGVLLVVTTVVVVALLVVASFRYSIALVDPPLPVPNYQAQAVIAYIGVALAIATSIVTSVSAGTHSDRRTSILTIGTAAIVGIGFLAAIAALTVPAL